MGEPTRSHKRYEKIYLLKIAFLPKRTFISFRNHTKSIVFEIKYLPDHLYYVYTYFYMRLVSCMYIIGLKSDEV